MTGFDALIDRLASGTGDDGSGGRATPAFVDGHGRTMLTRYAFAGRIRRAAGAFAAAGLVPGDAVAFGVRQDAIGIAWLLGAVRAGVTVVVLDPGLAPSVLVDRCRAAGTRAVVLDRTVALLAGTRAGRSIAARAGIRLPDPRRLPGPILVTGATPLPGTTRLDRGGLPDAQRTLDPDAPALVLFTSGTTGTPRGIVHTPRSLAATLERVTTLSGIGRGDRVLGNGLHLAIPALLAGASVVLTPVGDPRRLAAATRRLDVTHLTLPPHIASSWTAAGGAGPGLQRLFLGSAPVRNVGLRAIVDQLPPDARTWSIYGMTEQLLVAAIGAGERLDHDEREGDLVGALLPGVRVRTAPDGELWVAGPGLARGVLGDAGPVAELPTGDLGARTSDGRLILTGRRKEMIIRRGENIYPALYEAPIEAAASVAAAVLVGVPAPDGDERAVLWIEPRRGEGARDAVTRTTRVIGGAHGPIDEHARPDAILAIDRIPRSGRSGKPDRRALAILAATRLGLPRPVDPALPEAV